MKKIQHQRDQLEPAGDLLSPVIAVAHREARERFVRSSGPGGQNVNRVATRVELRWDIAGSRQLPNQEQARLLKQLGPRLSRNGELVVCCSTTRYQARNRAEARAKLTDIVAEALAVQAVRHATKPSDRSRERRLERKQARSLRKQQRGRVQW